MMQFIRLAYDRANRFIDGDGHMHIRDSVISSACVSPYKGREIPDFDKLGLDGSKTYMLLRDPEELKRATPSLAGKPLLSEHVPVTSDNHRHRLVVGAVQNPVWAAPNIRAELTIWDGAAIDAVLDGTEKALSAAYRYTPVMTPGTYNGVRYDGAMRDIVMNHVALVSEPRVPGAMVGDSAMRRSKPKTQRMLVMDSSEEPSPADAVSEFLKDKLSPEHLATVMKMLSGEMAGDDIVPRIDGVERVDGVKRIGAADSGRRSFADRFPHIARVRRV